MVIRRAQKIAGSDRDSGVARRVANPAIFEQESALDRGRMPLGRMECDFAAMHGI